MLEWLMFHRIVKKGREVRGGLLRTLVEKRVANVYPPRVFAASVTCHSTCANCQAREKDTSVCAVARHTCDDDECQERVAAVAPSTLVSLVPSNPSAT